MLASADEMMRKKRAIVVIAARFGMTITADLSLALTEQVPA
jgi:hypothetical protein